jgi:hypothetical protein
MRLGLPDAWIHQDSRARQLAEAGLDAAGIARAMRCAAAGEPAPAEAPATAQPPALA